MRRKRPAPPPLVRSDERGLLASVNATVDDLTLVARKATLRNIHVTHDRAAIQGVATSAWVANTSAHPATTDLPSGSTADLDKIAWTQQLTFSLTPPDVIVSAVATLTEWCMEKTTLHLLNTTEWAILHDTNRPLLIPVIPVIDLDQWLDGG